MEEENKAAVEKEKSEVQIAQNAQSSQLEWDSLGWRLLFISFSIMVILGFAVLYIYQVHRKETLEEKLEETEDETESRIHKILVDKIRKDA